VIRISIDRVETQMRKCKHITDVHQIQEVSMLEDPGTYRRSPLHVICKTAGQEMWCTYNLCHNNQDENVTYRLGGYIRARVRGHAQETSSDSVPTSVVTASCGIWQHETSNCHLHVHLPSSCPSDVRTDSQVLWILPRE
jgi:hypothetical protein